MTGPKHSPAPWTYTYNPHTVQSDHSPLGVGAEIPAYEILDAEGNRVFDTNEDSADEIQEANARMGAAAPRLLAALRDLLGDLPSVQAGTCRTCGRQYHDHSNGDCPSDDCPSFNARAAIAKATGAK